MQTRKVGPSLGSLFRRTFVFFGLLLRQACRALNARGRCNSASAVICSDVRLKTVTAVAETRTLPRNGAPPLLKRTALQYSNSGWWGFRLPDGTQRNEPFTRCCCSKHSQPCRDPKQLLGHKRAWESTSQNFGFRKGLGLIVSVAFFPAPADNIRDCIWHRHLR